MGLQLIIFERRFLIITIFFMRTKILYAIILMASTSIFTSSCKKDKQEQVNDPYNLDITLKGTGNVKGTIMFRQDPDTAKIITLDTKIEQLQPNHEYLLQRAVDTQIDGICTGTVWLTLGKGLATRSIFTNPYGKGSEELWRDISAIPSGSVFDIHFQVVDAANMAAVLKSDCYQYTVR